MDWLISWFALSLGFVCGCLFGVTVLRDIVDGVIGWPSRELKSAEKKQAAAMKPEPIPRAWVESWAYLNRPTVTRRRKERS